MQSARSSPLITVVSNIKGSPKWSFQAKPRDSGRKTETPGPGSYSVSSPENSSRFSKSPNYGFGNGSRDYQRPYSAPGPGQYSPDKNINSAKYGFGTSNRRGQSPRDHPGPGSYQIDGSIGNSSPKYTANKRRDLAATVDSPGPGAYQPNFQMSSSKSLDPKWGFSRSPREGGRLYDNPGPGQYNTGVTDRTGPKFTIRGRSDLTKPNITPGPGAHGPPHTQFG